MRVSVFILHVAVGVQLPTGQAASLVSGSQIRVYLFCTSQSVSQSGPSVQHCLHPAVPSLCEARTYLWPLSAVIQYACVSLCAVVERSGRFPGKGSRCLFLYVMCVFSHRTHRGALAEGLKATL